MKERGVDGVICGHIHAATIKEIGDITYINCGDWVDSCTAIVEHEDGHMELIEWVVPPQQVEPDQVCAVGPKPKASSPEPIRTPVAAREAE